MEEIIMNAADEGKHEGAKVWYGGVSVTSKRCNMYKEGWCEYEDCPCDECKSEERAIL